MAVTKLFRCGCDGRLLVRTERMAWMRLVPLMRLYYCNTCRCNMFTLKRPRERTGKTARRVRTVLYRANPLNWLARRGAALRQDRQ